MMESEVIDVIIEGKRIKSNPFFRKPYQTWKNMMERCYNPKNRYYINYGGKGITVCEKWHDFKNFLDDFDKIKGFTPEIFERSDIFLDKDGENLSNSQYNLMNCEFVDIRTSNKRKQHQMKKFRAVNLLTGESRLFYNQSECSRELGIRQAGISDALHKKNGQNGKFKGFLFEYTDL